MTAAFSRAGRRCAARHTCSSGWHMVWQKWRTPRLANGGLEAAVSRLRRLREVRLEDLAQAGVVHLQAAGRQQRDQLDLHSSCRIRRCTLMRLYPCCFHPNSLAQSSALGLIPHYHPAQAHLVSSII